ncbi:MAG: N-6 DNA methylase [Chloroflexi bacterium]|nr:N-6 DNA methylase [Chloroflexota bacterium]
MINTAPFSTYRTAIEQNVRAGNATEHTHRPALKALLESLTAGITATNEPKRVACGAPDYSVARDSGQNPLTIGYVEAKDVGLPLDPIERDSARTNPTTDNGRQFKRYRAALQNLILTDYLEFRWHVNGELRATARLGRLDAHGRVTWDRGEEAKVRDLLLAFLSQAPVTITKPSDLAVRMARLTHLIRDTIVTAAESGQASSLLIDLRAAFQDVLIPDLDIPQFADMFAQTLAYGLFAARVNHRGALGTFRRQDAAREIPRTNPFLRRLFATIAGPDLDDEPFAGFADDLTQLLAYTDVDAVLADFGQRTRQDDPVVHFYETFLKSYDPRLRELRGVYYTPEPVVSYIVRSVDHLLRTRFACVDGLADTATVSYNRTDDQGRLQTTQAPRVLILDPACGTGTFLYAVVNHIREEYQRQGNAGKWSGYVRDQLLPRLFGFELLMAPYAVAHLKLGMQLAGQDLPAAARPDWSYAFQGDERLGVYLTNSLEEGLKKSQLLLGGFISEEANAAAAIKREMPIMVVLGNPPYSGHSANASWREQTDPATGRTRRVPTWIGGLLQDYYQVDGKPLGEKNPKWLQDDYVKFLRFGQWRIQQSGAGVLAFITNHGYLDNPTFRGMRQQLMHTFTDIYLLDLHGNARKKEVAPDGRPDQNVFDIEQGVAVGIFVKEPGQSGPARVHHAHLWGTRQGKYDWLTAEALQTTPWTDLSPQAPFYLFAPQDADLRAEYEHGWSLPAVLPVNSVGIVTARDHLTIRWSAPEVLTTVRDFAALLPEEARTKYDLGRDVRDWKVSLAQQDINAHGVLPELVASVLYRPFDQRYTYYTGRSRGFICRPRPEVMSHMLAGKNVALVCPRRVETSGGWGHCLVASGVVEHVVVSLKTIDSVFPICLYPPRSGATNTQASMTGLSPWPEGKDGRRPNLNPDFVAELSDRLGLTFVPDGRGDLAQTFGPEDIFHYIYAVLHAPTYRSRYVEFLKLDFPRVPITGDRDLFRTLAKKGAALVALHLLESPALTRPITCYPVPGPNLVEPGHPRYLAPGEPEPGTGQLLAQGRVYLSKDDPTTGKRGQYFEGVPPDVWEFHVGGYQVCEKWLADRRGRTLSLADLNHYERIVVALQETIRLMEEIDAAIPTWPMP